MIEEKGSALDVRTLGCGSRFCYWVTVFSKSFVTLFVLHFPLSLVQANNANFTLCSWMCYVHTHCPHDTETLKRLFPWPEGIWEILEPAFSKGMSESLLREPLLDLIPNSKQESLHMGKIWLFRHHSRLSTNTCPIELSWKHLTDAKTSSMRKQSLLFL